MSLGPDANYPRRICVEMRLRVLFLTYVVELELFLTYVVELDQLQLQLYTQEHGTRALSLFV